VRRANWCSLVLMIQYSLVLYLCTNLKLLEFCFKQRFMTIRCSVVEKKNEEKRIKVLKITKKSRQANEDFGSYRTKREKSIKRKIKCKFEWKARKKRDWRPQLQLYKWNEEEGPEYSTAGKIRGFEWRSNALSLIPQAFIGEGLSLGR